MVNKLIRKILVGAAIASIFSMPLSAVAGDALSAEQIAAAVSDKTYQGSMTTDSFTEFYAADGSIKADGYSGKWRTTDNNMCFQYGTDPETCWKVQIEDSAMTLYKDGKVDGNGMLVKGNQHGFK